MDLKADIFTDPYCDPDHPVVIHFEDISAAAYKIRGGIKKTPCTVGKGIIGNFHG